MGRTESLVQVINDMQPLVKRFIDLTAIERMREFSIESEVSSLMAKQGKLLEENEKIKQLNESEHQVARKIVDGAKSEASNLSKHALTLNVESMKLLREIQEFCKGVDKRQYQEYKERLDKVGEKLEKIRGELAITS